MNTSKMNVGYKFKDGSTLWLGEPPKPKARKPFKAKAATLKLNTKSGQMELSSPVKPGDTVLLESGTPANGKFTLENGRYVLTVQHGQVVEYISVKELVNKGI